jgi:hypothetical protein
MVMKDKSQFPSKGSGSVNICIEGPITKDIVKRIKKDNPGKKIKINGKKY